MPSLPATALHDALLLLQSGRHREAVDALARLVAHDPTDAGLLVHFGVALRGAHRLDDAIGVFTRAIAAQPEFAEAHHQLGNALKRAERRAEALAALRQAADLAPNHGVIWLNLGSALLDAEQPAEAVRVLERAASLERLRPEAHNILGVALLAAGRLAEARRSLEHALQLRPGYAAAHDNLGRLCKAEGRLAEAVGHFRAALRTQLSPATHSNLLLALNYIPNLSPADVFAEHRRWNQLYAQPLGTRASHAAASPAPGADRRLRIGYLSPDFAHHAVAYFVEPVLAVHDRARFEVFCYASVRNPDAYTARLRDRAEHWRDVAALDDDAAADVIRRDRLDLLIDLAGHTAGHRLLVMARRPAPVQATWIGYPNTTGLDSIDFRLTDAVSDPPVDTEAFHTEKLIRLPTTFSCYQPDDQAPAVNALPAMMTGRISFGSFNNFAKITPPVVALWSSLLRALPGSSLFLKSRGLADAMIGSRLRAAFAEHGVAPEQLRLDGDELSVAEHLRLYHSVDIGLDPFPYNGTTTTCEALWMGVPVITLAGRVHAARVGCSLLTHVGLSDWIAADPEEYRAIAINAAGHLPRLAALRASLRQRMHSSPLCDAVKFTRGLEATFQTMIRR